MPSRHDHDSRVTVSHWGSQHVWDVRYGHMTWPATRPLHPTRTSHTLTMTDTPTLSRHYNTEYWAAIDSGAAHPTPFSRRHLHVCHMSHRWVTYSLLYLDRLQLVAELWQLLIDPYMMPTLRQYNESTTTIKQVNDVIEISVTSYEGRLVRTWTHICHMHPCLN
jgi:hypothetical protein